MDTRQALQLAPEPAVLSVAFNEAGTRLICGLDNGVRLFRAQDCIRVLKESPDPGQGIALAAALDDRYIALVGGGRQANSSPNKLQFWDNERALLVTALDFAEPILGLSMTPSLMVVVLLERTVYMQYSRDDESSGARPGSVLAIHDTCANHFALCSIRRDKSALPGVTAGQVQVINVEDKTKKIIRAHTSDLRQIDLSADGKMLATASRQGTIIRIFSTENLLQTHEFRRGVDTATIYALSISPQGHFIACTSDKGTLHIFDVRPPQTQPTQSRHTSSPHQRQASSARTPSHHRTEFDTTTIRPSAPVPSCPITQAGYYPPPPSDLAHTPPSSAPSAISALAKLPGMPRAFSDARSLTSAHYHLGTDPSNWQGQPKHTATTLPGGKSAKIRVPNVALPGLPDGRPRKGVLCWDPEGDERRLWCVGGGADARWEVFELVSTAAAAAPGAGAGAGEGGRLRLVRTGHRNYLTRQFPEK